MPELESSRHRGLNGSLATVRRASDSEAIAVWRDLCRGGWVVLDHIDDGHGRRFVLARPTARHERPWHRLSIREKAILDFVAAGHSNRYIARSLGISVSTVASHLRSARSKLGGPRRLDLVREWGEARKGETIANVLGE